MPRILVADDNAENLYYLEILLKGNHYDVATARNGSEALDAALESSPDLIITDILMPVMDGFSLCREWKSNERLKRIPFVFYTATYTESKDEEFALSLGADRFVVKPQEPVVLLGIIDDTLALARRPSPIPPDQEGPQEEQTFFKGYSDTLFRKLEKKMIDLESTNRTLLAAIEELEKAEASLKTSEAKYRHIFENAVMGIFRTDEQGRYLDINRTFAGMFGYDSQEEMVKAFPEMEERQFVDPQHYKKLKSAITGQGVVEGFESQIYRKDGTSAWIAINMRALQNHDSGFLWEGTAINITARKKAEDEKNQLENQLRQSQKMEAIGTLAGGVAHDFNNILTAIIGYASLLGMDIEKNDHKKIYIDQILASSQKAANLTQSLLAFSRKQAIELKALRVKTIIQEMEKILPRLLTEDIELRIEPVNEELTIMADLTQIDQVLLNLATNARDAMPNGGMLVIKTAEVKAGAEVPGVPGVDQNCGYVLLSVTDTGVGMDEATREKIFEPFFTTKEAGKGTGLGLSTVYGIVKQHDGHIAVDSEPDHGTVFRIYFRSARLLPEEPVRHEAPLARGTETILIAEDNNDLRMLIKDVLSRAGYSVIDAVDGDDAVLKFLEHRDAIELLILDVVMPRKNGQAVYEKIRELKPGIKALFTSGYTGDVVLDKGIADETVDFLSKPLPPVELLARVRQILDRKPQSH
jgi:PAS domain S-box-containing protein